jgi:hypothetical protein
VTRRSRWPTGIRPSPDTSIPLQNAAKYAQASAARVTLCRDGQWLAFTVEDDGQGFDPAATPGGTGLQGIADRLGRSAGPPTSSPPPATAPGWPAGHRERNSHDH